MYVADTSNQRIQFYLPGSNVGTTVAGVTGSGGTSRSELNSPSAVAVDQNGVMYILDTGNYRVLRWSPGDTIGTVIVNGRGSGTTLDRIGYSLDLFLDGQYNIYVSEQNNHRVTKWLNGNNNMSLLVKTISSPLDTLVIILSLRRSPVDQAQEVPQHN